MAQPLNRTATAGVGRMLLEPGGIERIRLAWRLARDPRVSAAAKMSIPALVMLYAISPIDLVPDFLLGLGQIDDLGLIAVGLALVIRILPRMAPERVVTEHLAAIRGVPLPAASTERGPSPSVIDADYRVR